MADSSPNAGRIEDDVLVVGRLKVDQRVDRAIVGCLRGQDLSSFEIWHWLEWGGRVEGVLTEPELHPTLYRLEADGLVESEWQEAERIRRKYRLTARGKRIADEHGWPALVLRGGGVVEHPANVHSPDPDAGSWFVPPRPAPQEPSPNADPGGDRTRAAISTADSGVDPAVAAFTSDLARAVDLPAAEARRVSQEMVDHLNDSIAIMEREGADRASAVAEAVRRMGDVRRLAATIDAAQHTAARRSRALRWAVFELIVETLGWLVLAAGLVVAAPGLAHAFMTLAGAIGVHLTIIQSAQWSTNQLAAMLCVGAFAAGRMSMYYLTRISRHRDETVRRRWAATGAIAILVVALLIPGVHDWFVVATLAVAPFAFVAGTYHPKHSNEGGYSWRGFGAALLFVGALMVVPGVRLFLVDLGGTPGAPAAPNAPLGRIDITLLSGGAYSYGAVSSVSGPVTIELWPAGASGLSIVVDPSAKAPAAVANSTVDLTRLAPSDQWWVVAVQTLPDGRRAAIAVVVQPGVNAPIDTTLGWLLGHL